LSGLPTERLWIHKDRGSKSLITHTLIQCEHASRAG
jgi:hypothetical protein